MELTETIAQRYSTTVFDVMAQECDEVIFIINYVLFKAESSPKVGNKTQASGKEYIKVDDRTATGGWW